MLPLRELDELRLALLLVHEAVQMALKEQGAAFQVHPSRDAGAVGRKVIPEKIAQNSRC